MSSQMIYSTRRAATRLLSTSINHCAAAPRSFRFATLSTYSVSQKARVQSPSYMIRSCAYSTNRSLADSLAEELQQIYAEAKDEFEIATESTDANMSYAQEDREAARQELEKLKRRWEDALKGGAAEELRKRPIGQRIRELEGAIVELEKRGIES